jgi:2-enoate reductase
MRTYENLGKPLQIGKLTIKNRFCMAPLGGSQHHLLSSGLKDITIQ